MAAFDGEVVQGAGDAHSYARRHLASCASCDQWMRNLDRVHSRLQGFGYPGAQVDLWATVEPRLAQPRTISTATRRLFVLGTLVLGWRTLQLSIDLPLPIVHPLVPLAGAIAALWLIARDPFAIETAAPELRKGGA
jgi:hypothetical protein